MLPDSVPERQHLLSESPGQLAVTEVVAQPQNLQVLWYKLLADVDILYNENTVLAAERAAKDQKIEELELAMSNAQAELECLRKQVDVKDNEIDDLRIKLQSRVSRKRYVFLAHGSSQAPQTCWLQQAAMCGKAVETLVPSQVTTRGHLGCNYGNILRLCARFLWLLLMVPSLRATVTNLVGHGGCYRG